MKFFGASALSHHHQPNEMANFPNHHPHPPEPRPPHERKSLMCVEFEDNDWATLLEVFGDPDSVASVVGIIQKAPSEKQIQVVQLIKIIQNINKTQKEAV